ncbi:unnamed protein product [Danaus chrysippus]|uniref:(African queen) hypothetical protein n=1 Tax=Danaus chrysippus TaxID=151541 RepID=A0A8J2QL71_9NEOP|nr:unnamed protein product [Danaus chrysippus]
MARVEDILEVHKNIAESLGNRMAEFEKQLKSTSNTEGNKNSLDKLASEFKEFKASVWNILDLLRTLVTNLSSQIDDIDNTSRRNALLFGGIQEAEGENLVSTVLGTIQVLMGIPDLQPGVIQYCHRIGSKSERAPRPIVVRFNDLKVKSLIWSSKKKLKSSPVVLSEFLTKVRQSLFTKARKRFGITNTWTLNGNIYIKLPNNERRRVTTQEDFDECLKMFPGPSPSSHFIVKPASSALPRVSPSGLPDASKKPLTRRNLVKKQ